MSSNQFLIDVASRHAVFVQRFSAGLGLDYARQVVAVIDEIVGRMNRGETPTLIDLEEAFPDFSPDLISFAINESEFAASMVNEGSKAEISPLSADDLTSVIETNVMELATDGIPQRITISQAVSQFSTRKKLQITQIIRDGFASGETLAQTSKKIADITPLVRRQAFSLARTLTNAVSSSSAAATYAANDDVLDGYEWVSTLDGLTSHICMARDGIVYPFSDESPLPPAHWSCRSTIIPRVKRQFDLLADVEGDRPSVGADGAERQGANTTYGGWLRRQPAKFQDEALGPTRAKLFRQGGLTIDRFVELRTGRTYTLEELRALNPLAFERANVA